MSWQKWLILVAEAFKGFELAGAVHAPFVVMAYVERNHAYGVAGNEEIIGFLIIQCEGEDAVEVFEKVDAFVAVKGKDNLAVATGLKAVGILVTGADVAVVVNLAVDCKNLLAVGGEQWLAATFGVDD